MYKKQNGNSSDKELIDISSDDETSKDESKTGKETKALNICSVMDESLHTPSMVASKSKPATSKQEISTSKPETSVSKPEIPASKSPVETSVKSKTVCIFVHLLLRF